MRLRGGGRNGLRASSRQAGWSALGLSIVSGAVALALVLTSGTTSGAPAGGFSLGKPGAIATTHMRLSADASAAAAAAPLSAPPILPAGKTARQALIDAQTQLGGQLSTETWSSQTSGVSTALTSLSALDNTHVWAAGAGCTLLFSANGGSTWTKDNNVPGGAATCAAATDLKSVSVQDNSHGWAVGSNGFILVCNANCNSSNAAWAKLGGASPPAPSVMFTGVWGNGNTVYAVANGVIWVCSANCNSATIGSGGGKSAWVGLLFAGNAFTSVTAAGGGNPAFAVGGGGVVRVCKNAPCTSAANWALLTGIAAANNFASVFAVDGNHIYAVGSNGSNGRIWACSAGCNNTVVGTGGGQAQWVDVTPLTPSPVPPGLTGVAGAGGPDGSVWAVGAGGAFWFCGSACSTLPSQWVMESPSFPASTDLAGVAANDPNHAWADGLGGRIFGMVQQGPPDDAITKALQGLGNALNPLWWPTGTDGNHVDPTKFQQVYDQAKAAESPLSGFKPNPPGWASDDVFLIEGAMRLLAYTELQDNACPPQQKPKEVDAAQKELDAGDKEWGKGNPDGSNDHYKNAYDHANKANGVPCAGITVSPAGSLLSDPNMMPGDNDSTPNPPDPDAVLVTMTTSAGTLTVQAANFAPAIHAAGDLAQFLKVSIIEYHTVLADGVLATYGPQSLESLSTTPLQLQGEGGGVTWNTNESHYFVITVSLPPTQDNSAQSKTTKFDFNWTRS